MKQDEWLILALMAVVALALAFHHEPLWFIVPVILGVALACEALKRALR